MGAYNKSFKDKEMVWFYWIVVGVPLLVSLVGITQGGWLPSSMIAFGSLCFLYFGWPLTAEITEVERVVFKGPLRRVTITPNSLATVKALGVYDYRAHLVLRNKFQIPIGYRCRKYENAPQLAQAVLNLIQKAPTATVTDDALKLLRHVAKGKTSPLPAKPQTKSQAWLSIIFGVAIFLILLIGRIAIERMFRH